MVFLTPSYPAAVLFVLRIEALFNELWFYKKRLLELLIFNQGSPIATSPLFQQNSILKFQDKICLENISFVKKSLNNLTPSVFKTWSSFSSDQHNYETSGSTPVNLRKPFYKTNRYGKCSIVVSAVELWNKIQKQLKDMLLKYPYPRKIKTIVTNFYLKSY